MRFILFNLMMMVAFTSVWAAGQGQFLFNNYLPAESRVAPIQTSKDGPRISGDEWTVQLFGGPTDNPTALEPLVPSSTTFRTGTAAGYVAPVTVTVPEVPPGKYADVLLRVVNSVANTYFDLGPYTMMLLGGDTPFPPEALNLGNSPLYPGLNEVPEPAIDILALLGLIVTLLCRRANKVGAGNSAGALLFHTQRLRRAVPDLFRSK